jgi:hypothetical protein
MYPGNRPPGGFHVSPSRIVGLEELAGAHGGRYADMSVIDR